MIQTKISNKRHDPSFMIVKNSIIYCHNKTSIVSDYNDYIVSLLKRFIENTNASININFVVFGNECTDFGNNNPTIRIECNYEHTLVLPDGRDTYNAVQGKLYDSEGKNTHTFYQDQTLPSGIYELELHKYTSKGFYYLHLISNQGTQTRTILAY